MQKEVSTSQWTINDSGNLYRLKDWGAGHFSIDADGDVTINSRFPDGKTVSVKLMDIISGITDRGLEMPVLLRVENLLDIQVTRLNESFRKSIKNLDYKGSFQGVYPIKVNQQQQVVQEVARFGSRYHHGLEAGSKAELIAALSILEDKNACLICNGYKDAEFVDLGLDAIRMGFKCFFVIEMPQELHLVLERAKALDVEPNIGIRIKLSSKSGGNWSDSGGDRSIFGLSPTQVIDVVDKLKEVGKLHTLKLLHFHQGSQIPNIRDIRQSVLEASRFYADLIEEGAPMGYLDIGGGLAIDYDGSKMDYQFSKNYHLDEYTSDVIEAVMDILDNREIPHPTIISESGRAIVAYYSILLMNVLDISYTEPEFLDKQVLEEMPEIIRTLYDVLEDVNRRNIQESLNDALYYRDVMRQQFKVQQLSLRERGYAENLFQHVLHKIYAISRKMRRVPPGLENLENVLADTYYTNLSVFQSLPDAWAIDQVFPIMPIHRLNEQPDHRGIIADITCDSDGKIDKFIGIQELECTLPLHGIHEGEEYYLGAFLVGAYQETLGDLHNLFGDTNVVSIRIQPDGSYNILREIKGDTIANVLEYVEYEINQLMERYRQKAELAVREGIITPKLRKIITSRFEEGLRGYTYYER